MGAFDPIATEIQDYEEVPIFRRRWFFVLTILFCVPAGIIIALSGEVYLKKGDAILAMSPAHRILIAVCWALILAVNLLRALT